MPSATLGATGAALPFTDRRVFRTSLGEMERRWDAVRQVMEEKNVDAIIVQSRRDFHGGYAKWFTDTPAFNPRTVIFYRAGAMTIIDHGAANGRRDVRGHSDYPGIDTVYTTAAIPSVHYTQREEAALAAAELSGRKCRRVAWVNRDGAAHGLADGVMQALGSLEFVDLSDAIDRIKACKSRAEILEIEKSCALQDRIFAELVDRVKPGMREYEVSALARYIGECEGSEQALYLVGSAPQNEAALLRNRHWQGRTINQGDYVNILIENNGAGGYYGEFLRTIVLGTAAPAIAEAFDIACEAQSVIAGLLRDGASPGALAQANDDILAARGLPVEDRLFAHGQGYDLVERPLLRADEPMPLEQGMNISIHPAVRGPTIYISLCDNFIVTQGGGERLHKTEQKLFEI